MKLALLLILIASVPARSQPTVTPAGPAFRPDMGVSEEQYCRRPIVSIDVRGDIFREGELLGAAARSFKAACSGDVAWTDHAQGLYKNGVFVRSSVTGFRLEPTGNLLWRDGAGNFNPGG